MVSSRLWCLSLQKSASLLRVLSFSLARTPAARMTLPANEQQRTHFQRVMNERTLSDHSPRHRGETAPAKHSTSRLSECDLRSLWLHKRTRQTEKNKKKQNIIHTRSFVNGRCPAKISPHQLPQRPADIYLFTQ